MKTRQSISSDAVNRRMSYLFLLIIPQTGITHLSVDIVVKQN